MCSNKFLLFIPDDDNGVRSCLSAGLSRGRRGLLALLHEPLGAREGVSGLFFIAPGPQEFSAGSRGKEDTSLSYLRWGKGLKQVAL